MTANVRQPSGELQDTLRAMSTDIERDNPVRPRKTATGARRGRPRGSVSVNGLNKSTKRSHEEFDLSSIPNRVLRSQVPMFDTVPPPTRPGATATRDWTRQFVQLEDRNARWRQPIVILDRKPVEHTDKKQKMIRDSVMNEVNTRGKAKSVLRRVEVRKTKTKLLVCDAKEAGKIRMREERAKQAASRR